MLVPWPGLSQQQALFPLLSISLHQSLTSGMDEWPPPSPSCSADPSHFVVPVVIFLVPCWCQGPEQGLWSQPGEVCLCPRAHGSPGTHAWAEFAPREESQSAQYHCYEAHAPFSQESKCLRLLLCSAKTSAPLSPPPLFPAPSFLSSLFPPVSFSNSSRDRSYSASSNSHVRLSTGPCFCC